MCNIFALTIFWPRFISYWNLVVCIISKMALQKYMLHLQILQTKASDDDRFLLGQVDLCMTSASRTQLFNLAKMNLIAKEAVRGVKWCEQQLLGLIIVCHFLDTCSPLLMLPFFLLIRVLSALTIPLMFLQSTLQSWTCFIALSRENIPTFYTTLGNECARKQYYF